VEERLLLHSGIFVLGKDAQKVLWEACSAYMRSSVGYIGHRVIGVRFHLQTTSVCTSLQVNHPDSTCSDLAVLLGLSRYWCSPIAP
jgi:hypothetical protein